MGFEESFQSVLNAGVSTIFNEATGQIKGALENSGVQFNNAAVPQAGSTTTAPGAASPAPNYLLWGGVGLAVVAAVLVFAKAKKGK